MRWPRRAPARWRQGPRYRSISIAATPAGRRAGQQAEQAEPRFPLAPFAEGLVLHDQKRFGEALAQFQLAAKRLEGSSFPIPDLFYYLGDTLGNLGEGAAAETAFKEEIRLSPGNIRARSSLAALYRAEGRNAEAEQTIAALLDAVPTAEAYNDVARLWTVFGEAGRAAAVRAEAERRFARTRAVTGASRQ
jgi:tetratricopeptide (TPR) repeat protein